MEEHGLPDHYLTPENEPCLERWTPQTVTKLLFLSFRHSQGSPEIQRLLFDYVRFRDGQRIIPRSWTGAVRSTLRTAIGGYLQLSSNDSIAPHHKKISAKLVSFEISRSLNSLKAAYDEPEPLLSPDELIATISTDLVFRELSYFSRSNGRPCGRKVSPQEGVHTDPFFSYVRYYAIELHPTGLSVFDALYHDISDYIQRSREVRDLPYSEKSSILFGDEFLAKLDAMLTR